MASLLPEMCLSSRPMLKWQLHHTVYNYLFETRGRPRFWNSGLLLHRLEEVKSLNRMNSFTLSNLLHLSTAQKQYFRFIPGF